MYHPHSPVELLHTVIATQMATHWAVVWQRKDSSVTTTMGGWMDKHDMTQMMTLWVQLWKGSH